MNNLSLFPLFAITLIILNILDVDECKNRNICGTNAKCVNTFGGYECDCKHGYEKIELTAKSRCRDTNECLFGSVSLWSECQMY